MIRGILFVCGAALSILAAPDLILYNGKIATVDANFSIQEAVAIADGKIARVGKSAELLKEKGAGTEIVDLRGRFVLPGLIDSHAHPADAAMTEFEHPIPDMETISDVLGYVRERARLAKEGEWIEVRQIFITRLKEQRYPSRAELDEAAPRNPVIFATGPDASLNSRALNASGIDQNFQVTDGGSGFAEKDANGEPTGILRNATRFIKIKATHRTASVEEKAARLKELFADYNSVGITSVADRDCSPAEIEIYQLLHDRKQMTVRANLSHQMSNLGPIATIEESIRGVGRHPLFKNGDDLLRIIGIKLFLDGGMLTGSAYMNEPWGVSEIYSIKDPTYRGVLFIPKDRLVRMVRAAFENDLQFTAHSVGDGAVQTLVEAYEEVNKTLPIRPGLASISHCNFMNAGLVESLGRLGIYADIQPAWLYLDTRTLEKQFGYDRLRYFQPLHSLFAVKATVGGGSDHMQKLGSLRSINPYNPFLGMATAITRRAKSFDRPLHPEEALTREEAIRFYTINNAKILRCAEKLGSLEAGKIADVVVLDTDLLTCPEDKIASTHVVRTYLAGKQIFTGEK
jgi:predicted amidohydrolase YtcJ